MSSEGRFPRRETRNTVTSEWSKSEETWQKVNAILTAGLVASVEDRQIEARAYLEEVESRLNDIIKKAQIGGHESIEIPESAALLPSGNVNTEIRNAVGAINLINDKQLKFQLTTFIDDYRRILEQNRDAELMEVAHDLESYFEEGSFDYVSLEVENSEMKESMDVVTEQVNNMRDSRIEVLSKVKKLKQDNEQAELLLHKCSAMDKSKASKEDSVVAIFEILNKPHVAQAIGIEDLITLKSSIENLAALKEKNLSLKVEVEQPVKVKGKKGKKSKNPPKEDPVG